MRLPDTFLAEMAELWQTYQPEGTLADFLVAHQERPSSGLRVNPLKLTATQLLDLMPAAGMTPVPWSTTGFYIAEGLNPGRLPFYHAGLYYIQEPSAMLPAEILAAQPGDIVLDLCAAPGGKSSRLAAMVGETGLLWSNEINGERAKALLRNLELMGVDRVVITQETPERLAAKLPLYFDRILVDAPCSGSGMFRRDPSAVNSWEKYGPAACAQLQQGILESADQMLKPGGYLVYSTCSFSLLEDEMMIASFIVSHPDYQIVKIEPVAGISPGLLFTPDLRDTARIWPHLTRGDGHYCALMHKQPTDPTRTGLPGETEKNLAGITAKSLPTDHHVVTPGSLSTSLARDLFKQWAEPVFSAEGLARLQVREEQAYYRLHQDHLHLVPDPAINLHGLKLVKTGLYLGQFRTLSSRAAQQKQQQKNRNLMPIFSFEPAHALLLTLRAADLQLTLRLKADDPILLRYLRGETIEWPEASRPAGEWPTGAWVAVCLDDYPLGWARTTTPGQLKNLYPPGWRKMN
jgi:16S rRNA C967 or C1407 C5-methylase (RsmB/RsmF family)